MISKIETLNYRCRRDIAQPLERFQLLVGPNASGDVPRRDPVPWAPGLGGPGDGGPWAYVEPAGPHLATSWRISPSWSEAPPSTSQMERQLRRAVVDPM